MKPITDKCLGLVGSNHHGRFDGAVGMSLDGILSDKMKIPLGKLGIINITCGSASYYVAMHHGGGGGKRRGSKSANLEELGDLLPSADIYMEGHTHTFDSFINEVPYIDKKRGNLKYYKAYFITTWAFLRLGTFLRTRFKIKTKTKRRCNGDPST